MRGGRTSPKAARGNEGAFERPAEGFGLLFRQTSLGFSKAASAIQDLRVLLVGTSMSPIHRFDTALER